MTPVGLVAQQTLVVFQFRWDDERNAFRNTIRAGVTVVAAPSGKRSRSGAVLAPSFLNAPLALCRDRKILHRHLDRSILPIT